MGFDTYLISPRDLMAWARGLGLRDAWGFGLMLVAATLVGLWLQDPGAGLFAAGLVLALWWRVDSRWALGAALALLVLIPLMQFLFDRNWLYSGAALAGGLAVAVWYLLAIGVVRAVIELRGAPAKPPAPEEITSIRDISQSEVKSAHASAETRPRRRPVTDVPRPAPATTPVPSWRRRLAAIEAGTRTPEASRHSVDGVQGRRR